MKGTHIDNVVAMLSSIVIVLTIALALAIVETPVASPHQVSPSENITATDMPAIGNESFGYVWIGPLNSSEWLSYGETPKKNMTPAWWSFNQTPIDEPHTREAVIVYFQNNPTSMDTFAASYGITPIFYKADIRMAIFLTVIHRFPLVMSNRTREAIDKLSGDPLVELAFQDTYLFLDRREDINATTSVTYPEDYDRKGFEYIPHQVLIGFWRIPPSMDEFSARCGGKPVNLTEADLEFKWVLFETEDMDGFIDRASQDPYVRYVELNGIWHTFDNETTTIGILPAASRTGP